MRAKKDVLTRVLIGDNEKKQPHEICEMVYGENHSYNELQYVQRELRRRAQDTAGLETYPGLSDEDEDIDGNGYIKPYRGKRYYWWENQELKDLWQLSNQKNVHMAQFVAFTLLDKNLNSLLPPEVASYVSPLVRQDKKKIALKNKNTVFSNIEDKIELIQQAVAMQPKDIGAHIRNTVFSAVLESKVIEACYDSKYDKEWSGCLTLSLQKLVFKYNHLKVVAYNHNCDQVREIYVRRLKDIRFIEDIDFVSTDIKPIKKLITLRTDSEMFYESYFNSVHVGEDQVIEKDEESNNRLIKFIVTLMPNKNGDPDYFDLVNQLCSWADAVDVVSPPELRLAMEKRIKTMVKRYSLNL